MTLFFILACLLVVAALATILPSALKSGHAQGKANEQELNQLDTNIKIAKERRSNLQRSLNDGAIDQATFDTELADLENALATDLAAEQNHQETSRSGMVAAGLIALFVPIASGVLYLHLGTPNAVDTDIMHQQALAAQQQQQEQPNTPAALTELLPNLEKKLEANPEDRDGWKLLGKSYLTIGEFSNAKRALMRAYNLNKEDPEVLAQLAEATAMDRGGDLSGKAGEYLDAALAIDPEHQQSLWLKAIASQQAGKHEEAITRFEALRAGVSGNASAQTSIDEMLNQSKQALGMSVELAGSRNEQANQSAGDTANSAASQSAEDSEGASLTVTVSLADNATADAKPTDSVFIFARASNGPPMPLAVSRHVVSELPITVVLDDSMAMIPAMTLGTFPSVTVGARVSKSGNAIAQPGDWSVELNDVVVADTDELSLIIDQQK